MYDSLYEVSTEYCHKASFFPPISVNHPF